MNHEDKARVLSLAKEHNVQFVDMQFTDILGILKAITIPATKLEEALENNVWFDGSSVEGFTRIFESDMYLKPDTSTFAILPWTKGTGQVTARFICDVYMPDGTPFEGDPRYILKKQVERAEAMGYKYYVGPELEFFLFKMDEEGNPHPLPHDRGGYFDQTMDLAAKIRRDMTFGLQAMDVDVEALHHEVAVGQHEIDFKYDEAVKTADNAMTFKHVLKAIANLYDLHATFMPKPIAKINGSGMHVHQSLFKDGSNAFYDGSDQHGLSSLAKSFIAGQLSHIKALNAIINPTVNSYKRLVVGYEAPVYVAWATRNRSALMRIPKITSGRTSATRCELRCPDPTANPYLAFAVMLAAGLDGIEKNMTPPDAVEENIFEFTDAESARRGIGSVAGTLKEAIDSLEKDDVVRGVLGEHTFGKFYEAKSAEWDDYRVSVSKWEHDRYLELY